MPPEAPTGKPEPSEPQVPAWEAELEKYASAVPPAAPASAPSVLDPQLQTPHSPARASMNAIGTVVVLLALLSIGFWAMCFRGTPETSAARGEAQANQCVARRA